MNTIKVGLIKWAKLLKGKKECFCHELTNKLEELMPLERDDVVMEELISTKVNLTFEVEKEEMLWEQRVRVNWLRNGDKNTTFFHKFTTQRRRHNLIRELHDQNGCLVSKDNEMEVITREYYQSFYA